MITRMQANVTSIGVSCSTQAIATALGVSAHPDRPPAITLTERTPLARSGTATRLVQASGIASEATPARSLSGQATGHRPTLWVELRRGAIDIGRLAAREGVSGCYLTPILRLAFLSPSVVQAELAGKQRAGMTSRVSTLDMIIPAS